MRYLLIAFVLCCTVGLLVVHVIVLRTLPTDKEGKRFPGGEVLPPVTRWNRTVYAILSVWLIVLVLNFLSSGFHGPMLIGNSGTALIVLICWGPFTSVAIGVVWIRRAILLRRMYPDV